MFPLLRSPLGSGTVASVTGSPLDELLAAVGVVRCSSDRCVRHEVDGERGDVGRADDAPDRQRLAELLATRVQLVAEQRCRQRRVNEAGRYKVDADGCELECERLGERRQRGGECRVPPGRTLPTARRATCSGSQKCSSTLRRARLKSMSASRE